MAPAWSDRGARRPAPRHSAERSPDARSSTGGAMCRVRGHTQVEPLPHGRGSAGRACSRRKRLFPTRGARRRARCAEVEGTLRSNPSLTVGARLGAPALVGILPTRGARRRARCAEVEGTLRSNPSLTVGARLGAPALVGRDSFPTRRARRRARCAEVEGTLRSNPSLTVGARLGAPALVGRNSSRRAGLGWARLLSSEETLPDAPSSAGGG
ncbi:MAG: hypothetical protein CHACPFDD_01111 [Phycisphaerae bacterium]|nr:hypothetical protein [Phycisphaerae bacterium]